MHELLLTFAAFCSLVYAIIVVQIPLERDDDDEGATPFVGLSAPQSKKKPKAPEGQKSSAIDITAEDLLSRLTPQNVADLVLLSMVRGGAHFQPNL